MPDSGKQFRIGHSYVTPAYPLEAGETRKWFQQVVETEIGPLLEEYWFDAPGEAQKALRTPDAGLVMPPSVEAPQRPSVECRWLHRANSGPKPLAPHALRIGPVPNARNREGRTRRQPRRPARSGGRDPGARGRTAAATPPQPGLPRSRGGVESRARAHRCPEDRAAPAVGARLGGLPLRRADHRHASQSIRPRRVGVDLPNRAPARRRSSLPIAGCGDEGTRRVGHCAKPGRDERRSFRPKRCGRQVHGRCGEAGSRPDSAD